MKTVFKKATLIVILIFCGVFNGVAQERQFVIQGDNLDLKLGHVHIYDLYFMDNEFTKLETLGIPTVVHFEDRFSELYWVYTYENYKLTYVDIGEGPVLFQIEIDTSGKDIKLDGWEVTTLHTFKSSSFGSSKDKVLKVNKDTNETVKFGDKVEFIEVLIHNNKVIKLIYRHDLQI